MRTRQLSGLAAAAAACALAASGGAALAQAASWHLVPSFGRNGIAGLPVKERLAEPPNQGAPSPPERYRSLLVQGPRGSVYVGGYAQSKPGAFLISHISASGRLVTSFGHGGVSVLPAIRWVKQAPPSMHALAGGGVLIVGISRTDELVAVRLSARGQLDSGFGHDGVAEYKVAGAHGFAIVTAAVVEPNGDILAVYQKELPQPSASSPRVPEGQGNGAIKYVRLLPSGALDGSFGKAGILDATGEKVAFIEGESGTVGACAETLSTNGSLLVAYEGFALEELNPAGAVLTSFGENPTQQPGGMPTALQTKNDYHFCNGLFALAGGAVEGISGVGSGPAGVEISRLTPSGMPEAAFGTAGSTRLDISTEAAAIAASGETFTVGESRQKLALTGILPNGRLDPALGGAAGQRFAMRVPRGGGSVPGEEKPTWEVLPVAGGLFVRVGE